MSKIMNTYKAKHIMEGAGVPVNRVFGYYETDAFDPFLMLDYFDSKEEADSPGFPWHPHRGIETITYFLKGGGEHEDSMGNKGVIGPDELQWMSAGSGIYHQEMPLKSPDGTHGFQFWVNLPKDKKMKKPDYQYIKKGEMKTVDEKGAKVRVISGNYKGTNGVINKEDLAITMLHVSLEKGASLKLRRDEDKQGFLFLFRGEGTLDDENVEQVTAYTLKSGEINITAQQNMEFIFAQGRPLKEPVAWRGPIVMNTEEELFEAFRELQDGKFIK